MQLNAKLLQSLCTAQQRHLCGNLAAIDDLQVPEDHLSHVLFMYGMTVWIIQRRPSGSSNSLNDLKYCMTALLQRMQDLITNRA